MKRLADLRAEVDDLAAVARELHDARETLEVLGDEAGGAEEADRLIAAAGARLESLEMAANFDREYDGHGAIVTIHAGWRRRRRRLGADAGPHVPALG